MSDPKCKITVLPNGPYIVEHCSVYDTGGACTESDKVALCACGNSKTKPFCDGSHKVSEEA